MTTTADDFTNSEGLRALLVRLHAAGPDAWRRDREAAALMAHITKRYAGLARRYQLNPDDAASAAFEALLGRATRNADDPWAVVTWAVRITLGAEHRAEGLLTSADRARRPEYSSFHDPERFSDRETDLADYHPAFRTKAADDLDDTDAMAESPVQRSIRQVVELLAHLGWNPTTVRDAVEYICSRLPDFGDRTRAYEALRRDKAARVLLDLPHAQWVGLLRLTIGNPGSSIGRVRRGLLARILVGESVADLLNDETICRPSDDALSARPGGDR